MSETPRAPRTPRTPPRSPSPTWAPWCGPCKQLGPELDEIAGEHSDKITIVKLDVDANPQSARDFRLMSLPTLVVFRDGDGAQRIVGAKAKAELLKGLDALLS
ncbi:co-chaperone YbbN [Amycolatopsis sp. FDAARGOS 1241]|uniref:thioredoxin family protein n=1 Tax=Amycolatopsis sp. FDAARGOS 1241 TaxID=2778070 RepID=UPI001950F485|nr:thioredoxin domain-containing protein [Amycolatopsis sp. FDAARGOS 1241]QRP50307.1 thiol reductase thioredoxin [Amycolatopsis sp. FDAARGOS 1241]